jgi:polyhydroxybutyrate depolymerase
MKRLVLFLVVLGGCGGDDDDGGADGPIGGIDAAGPDAPPSLIDDRPYMTTIPDSYDPAVPAPLVVLLHGYGANGFVQNAYWMMNLQAEAHGFLLAFPDGTVDSGGSQFWNATDGCCNFDGADVDDVAYLGAVIDDMRANYNVDPRRIYVIGHSNGGFMSHRMACDRADVVAAIVSLAGMTWFDPAQCQPSEPVAVLQVHGDMDETVTYEGALGYPSAAETVSRWAQHDGCTGTFDEIGRISLIDLAGSETRQEAWQGCPAGAAELWTIEGGTHIPGFDETWGAYIWAWLEAHPKP